MIWCIKTCHDIKFDLIWETIGTIKHASTKTKITTLSRKQARKKFCQFVFF